MNLEQYGDVLRSAEIHYSLTKLTRALELVLQQMQEAMSARNEESFVYFITVPPADVVNKYYQASEFLSRKWTTQGKPVVVIVHNDEVTSQTNAESIVSYDLQYRFVLDVIYPFYNISEDERSADKFYRFLDNFVAMFELSGRKWVSNGSLYVDRTAISVEGNELMLYTDILCHVATCSVTFTLWYPSVTEELDLGEL